MRIGISILLMLLGISIVLGAALFGTNYALSAYQVSNRVYLESTIIPTLDINSWHLDPTPTPFVLLSDIPGRDETLLFVEPLAVQQAPVMFYTQTVEPNSPTQSATDTRTQSVPTFTPSPVQDIADAFGAPEAVNGEMLNQPTLTPTSDQPLTQIAETTSELQPRSTHTAITETQLAPTTTATLTETQLAPTITATLTPTHVPVSPSQPVVRLKIPNINVDRAVVDIGLVPGKNGGMQWDSDSLFATRSRQDLVGHLDGSALPGESSNIVLVGHNYDWGIFQWNGVFYNLKKLKPGDKIILSTQGGQMRAYRVEKVKEIPFNKNGNEEDLFKHFKHMGPTESERLTLVTCGGANFWKWNKRVYVIAYPQSE
ncbi:class F sortase [Chloroflexota bacterium]